MRAAPGCFAEFITAFEAEETASKNKGPEPLWLIWQYEGDYTLFDLMQKKDFPYNLEQPLLGRELDMPKGPQRKAVTISLVMQQVGFLSGLYSSKSSFKSHLESFLYNSVNTSFQYKLFQSLVLEPVPRWGHLINISLTCCILI